VRSRKLGAGLAEHLQNLALRSYSQIYQGRQRQHWREVTDFYLWELPAIVRQTWLFTATATVIFLLGASIGWWFAWRDPAFLDVVVPDHIRDLVENEGKLWMGSIVGIEPLASSWIMTNNIAVALTALAGGVITGLGGIFIGLVLLMAGGLLAVLGPAGGLLAGLGLVLVRFDLLGILWNNGLHIGAIATFVGQHRLAYPFWAFVFPHGALELPAIFLAGGAGLMLSKALVFPGRYKRLVALKLAGGKAIQIMFGVVPMLVIAGIIEGFFSPNPNILDAFKYLVGLLIFIGLLLYLGRRPVI
jgi:uncharacterized membrane protein SpoIIM required for sporulation